MIQSILGFVVINMTTRYSLSYLARVVTRGRRSLSVSTRAGHSDSNALSAQIEKHDAATSTTKTIADYRREYSQKGLDENDPLIQGKNPFPLFGKWLNDAIQSKLPEPNAMCLSTCSLDNQPSARFVLLKGFDEERGFVWYTNYTSKKSEELTANPKAAITFFWVDLERQVRIEGRVEKLCQEESDIYFAGRPRGSQIGAWSSDQSKPIANRELLEKQELDMINRFANESAIPKPPHWGGWRLIPNRIEFWKGRASRLHDRIVFERKTADPEDLHWSVARLQP